MFHIVIFFIGITTQLQCLRQKFSLSIQRVLVFRFNGCPEVIIKRTIACLLDENSLPYRHCCLAKAHQFRFFGDGLAFRIGNGHVDILARCQSIYNPCTVRGVLQGLLLGGVVCVMDCRFIGKRGYALLYIHCYATIFGVCWRRIARGVFHLERDDRRVC